MNTNSCQHFDCKEQPTLDITIVYDGEDAKGRESRVSYCEDHIGERVWALFRVGRARTVAIIRVDQ